MDGARLGRTRTKGVVKAVVKAVCCCVTTSTVVRGFVVPPHVGGGGGAGAPYTHARAPHTYVFGGGVGTGRGGPRWSVMPKAPPARGMKSAAERFIGPVLREELEIELPSLTTKQSTAAGVPAPRPPSGVDPTAEVDPWDGHKHGFDWQLERARRTLTKIEGPAFTPFRMDFWKPPPAEEGRKIGEVTVWDSFKIMATNAFQLLTKQPGIDGAPVADIGTYQGSWTTFVSKVMSGQLEELAGGPLFLLLAKYFEQNGPVYKLMFGPRSFMVVADPAMVKHVLKNSYKYDKGVLAEILEPIMGKGLIPADPITWKTRRRAIVPGFHSRWLNRMVRLFADCSDDLIVRLDQAASGREVVDMETLFCSVSLDIIGQAVFNYEFASVNKESPVIKSVYSTLREAEHRSMSFVPYWKIPFADKVLPDQVEFKANMKLLNSVLDKLIDRAVQSADKADLDDLTNGRNYDDVEDASLLRFLVDMRGENTTSTQLRDDLMTMLIAGHETSAAVLTWTLYELHRNPKALADVRAEVDALLGDRVPMYDDVKSLLRTRLALVEALRLYPEPPILIRRALEEDVLPQGSSDVEGGVKLLKGTDVFISTWILHRSPDLWDRPTEYRPERWLEPFSNPGIKSWAGYDPRLMSGLYPNEASTDFAFLPFGGGARKCIGDQFAIMETTVIIAMLLRRFEFDFEGSADDVGMRTGATIHTENGLNMRVRKRVPPIMPPKYELHPLLTQHQSSSGPMGMAVGGKRAPAGGCPM